MTHEPPKGLKKVKPLDHRLGGAPTPTPERKVYERPFVKTILLSPEAISRLHATLVNK